MRDLHHLTFSTFAQVRCKLSLFSSPGVSYLNMMFHTGPWTIKLSKHQWFVRQALIDTSLTASVLNLLAVAVERHQTIFNMQLHSEMSTRRIFVVIVFIWLVAFIMGLVPTMGWHCLCDLENCSTMAPMYSRQYLVFWALLNLLTFSIMVAIYTHIFVYVRRKSIQMAPHTSQMRHRETVLSLMKTVSLILGEEEHKLDSFDSDLILTALKRCHHITQHSRPHAPF